MDDDLPPLPRSLPQRWNESDGVRLFFEHWVYDVDAYMYRLERLPIAIESEDYFAMYLSDGTQVFRSIHTLVPPYVRREKTHPVVVVIHDFLQRRTEVWGWDGTQSTEPLWAVDMPRDAYAVSDALRARTFGPFGYIHVPRGRPGPTLTLHLPGIAETPDV